jgi:hypothetical protein
MKNEWYDLESFSEYSKKYGRSLTLQVYDIINGLVTTWHNIVDDHNEQLKSCSLDEIKTLLIKKHVADLTIREILKTFGQSFHGRDEAYYQMYEDLDEYLTSIQAEKC